MFGLNVTIVFQFWVVVFLNWNIRCEGNKKHQITRFPPLSGNIELHTKNDMTNCWEKSARAAAPASFSRTSRSPKRAGPELPAGLSVHETPTFSFICWDVVDFKLAHIQNAESAWGERFKVRTHSRGGSVHFSTFHSWSSGVAAAWIYFPCFYLSFW